MNPYPLGEKFVKKYMRLAKQVGEDNNPCYSRHIGVVLVKVYPDGDSHVVGTGYNGPPKQTPHCDSREYLKNIVWPQLKPEEKRAALVRIPLELFKPESPNKVPHFNLGMNERGPEDLVGKCDSYAEHVFVEHFVGCKTCPRKVVGAKSGERLELCSCEHAERNAIYNATEDLHGTWAFCWCGVACWDCTKALINAGISRCFFIDDGSYARNGGSDYSFGSRWLFEKRGVSIYLDKPEFYLS
jgi:deoxycytidylate deaminase